MLEDLKILIIDDDKTVIKILIYFFKQKNIAVFSAETETEAKLILSNNNIDIILLDIYLDDVNGFTILEKIKKDYPTIEIIMMTGYQSENNILKAMRLGAFDFFYKPLNLQKIQEAIERTSKYVTLQRKVNKCEIINTLLTKEFNEKVNFKLIGNSEAMQKVFKNIMVTAEAAEAAVLITGPSGSGKELVARAIHYASQRKNNYFYPLNCAAIPSNLIESELFGHKSGAFTGASYEKTGCFEAANNGTLFLDEIGDMPFEAQTKILRVLEDSKIRKIGSNTEIDINVRIISATNTNLQKLIDSKKFRLDLFYRINTIVIDIPPLKDRKDDIPLLIEYYIEYFSKKYKKKFNTVDSSVYNILQNYSFPGNVRELRNIIEHAVILCNDGIYSPKYFPLTEANETKKTITLNSPEPETFDFEKNIKNLIIKALKKTNNNKTHAAKLLNISRMALIRKCKKYKLIN